MSYRNNVILQMGPVAAPVNIDSAVQSESSLKTVCVGGVGTPHAPTAVKRKMVCPTCGNDDPSTHKRAEVDGSDFTVVDQAEVATVRETSVGVMKQIIQLSAHPVEEVREGTIQGSSTYFLVPSKPALMPLYGLVVDALFRHPELAFLGQWAPSTRANLYEVRLHGESTLVMEERARTESLKIVTQPAFEVPELNQQQMDTLLPTMVRPYDPTTYADTFRRDLEALLASKQAEEGVLGERSKPATASLAAGAVDLSALLSGALATAGVTTITETKKRTKKAA